MRYFDYLENYHELKEAYYICNKIINDVLEFDDQLLTKEEKQIFKEIKTEALLLNNKLNFNIYEISQKINDDFLEPSNVEYSFKHQKFPKNASKLGQSINDLFKKIFIIEEKMQIIVSNIWSRLITPFEKIQNGDPFIVIGHSGNGYINFPSSKYYINNSYNNTTSYSCSIFTNNHINVYNSKLVALFNVNYNNFISASHFDSATRSRGFNKKTIKTLKTTDEGNFINVGYSNPQDTKRIVTKSESPTITLAKLKKNIVNEVVLDKMKSKPIGLLIFSNGDDFLFFEYINALKMKNEYNLNLKVINKSLYQDIEFDLNQLNKSLLFFKNYIFNSEFNKEELVSLLDGYIEDVIIPLKLNKDIEKIQMDFIEQIKEELKQIKY